MYPPRGTPERGVVGAKRSVLGVLLPASGNHTKIPWRRSIEHIPGAFGCAWARCCRWCRRRSIRLSG